MKNKRNRLQLITDILRSSVVGSQEELLDILLKRNCEVTQATLSRDLKFLKVAKTPLSNGAYKYNLPTFNKDIPPASSLKTLISNGAALSLEFSGNLAVIKTKVGYANAIALDIDNKINNIILGTIAGDDTILVIPREGVNRDEIVNFLNDTFISES